MPAAAASPAKASPLITLVGSLPLDRLLDVTLVRVSVNRMLKLQAYPLRHGEVVIHHVARRNLSRASRVKPHQVLFVVDAVPAGHTLLLRASRHNPVELGNLLSHHKPREFHGAAPIAFFSGKPNRGPRPHEELVWEYDILLRDDRTGKVIDLIDPPVIVKEDP